MNKTEFILSSIFLKFFYYIFAILPVNKNKVTFSTPRNSVLDGNMKYIYRALEKENKNIKFVFLFDTYSYSFVGKVMYLFRLIKGVYHLATSRVFIVDNAYFPVHIIKHKEKTIVIQVWHAAGALKKFGNDVENENEKVEDQFRHKNYDYFIAGSDYSKKHFATAFGMDEDQALVLGSARTDIFFNDSIKERVEKDFYEAIPDLKDKKIILYAPTFRGRGDEAETKMHLDVKKMKEKLEPLGYVLLYKPHLNAKSEENEGDSFIRYLGKEFVLNKLMIVADVFITDYSSAIIEYAPLKRPMILYAYDLDEYIDNPGFYQNFETEVAGELVSKTDEVIDRIINDDFDYDYYDEFINIHYKYVDGKSSERIAEYLIDNYIGK